MRKVEIREVTERRSVVVEVTCCLCGAKATDPSDWPEPNWATKRDYGNVAQTKVQIRRGYSYPDGWSINERTYEICPACFENKLIPWLAKQGAQPTETESAG